MRNLNSDSAKRRRTSKASNLERLLDAAEAVFAERGFHGTNIHEVCARAGVGIGTFYSHFDDKRALLKRVMTERAVTVADIINSDDLTTRTRIAAKMRAIVDEPLAVGLWRAWHQGVVDYEALARFSDEWRKSTRDRLAASIREARRSLGVERPGTEAEIVAWTLMTLMRELAINERRLAPDVETLAALFEILIRSELPRSEVSRRDARSSQNEANAPQRGSRALRKR